MEERKKTNSDLDWRSKVGVKEKGINKLIKKLENNSHSLKIDRVPPGTKREFKKFAMAHFCNDFGMALKWLVDGVLTKDIEAVLLKLSELDDRVNSLENKKVVEDIPVKSVRKMLDGSFKDKLNREEIKK